MDHNHEFHKAMKINESKFMDFVKIVLKDGGLSQEAFDYLKMLRSAEEASGLTLVFGLSAFLAKIEDDCCQW